MKQLSLVDRNLLSEKIMSLPGIVTSGGKDVIISKYNNDNWYHVTFLTGEYVADIFNYDTFVDYLEKNSNFLYYRINPDKNRVCIVLDELMELFE